MAAFGDSLMWGQGNKRNRRFSQVFIGRLQASVGKQAVLVWDASRSGSKIRDLTGEREKFADVYPHLFPSVTARADFLSGKDDSPASGLYGEIPATFPTVLGQVEMIPAAKASQVDIALVDGGINDISPEDVINPLLATGTYIERFDGEIRRIVDDNVTALLERVRNKCPNAVILYFGFFPGLSYSSDPGQLRQLFKHEYDSDVKWWLNQYVYEVIDANEMINEAMTRALWFNGRWQYWTRKAVNSIAANDAKRGPGIVFVPSGFGTGNAGLTTNSYLWDDYTYPTQDPAVSTRVNSIPRYGQLTKLRNALTKLSQGTIGRNELQLLDTAINGPLTLKRDINDFIGGQSGARQALLANLVDEIHRIQHGMIASLAHPNGFGSVRYAVRADQRYAEHLAVKARVLQENLAGPNPAVPIGPPSTLDGLLRRYNLRTGRALDADVVNLDVDSIAVTVKTAPNSSRNMGLAAYLIISTLRAHGVPGQQTELLTFKYYVDVFDAVVFGDDPIGKPYPYLEPGRTNRFTLVIDDLKLSDITGVAIALGDDPWPALSAASRRRYGRSWSPDWVALEINGQPVHTAQLFGRKLGPNSSVDLGWPAPNPSYQQPTLPVARVRRVRKLGKAAANPNIPGRSPPR
ncbi:SGNH/GDSL hydrolase family protein [Mesorhizobium muleiense]|uniref:SGNH/GDSL hydrolase family protein n=1 Tax=Mesorhizobium muleiense TaxID=1004279 RepID=UPI003AFB3F19